MRTKIEFSPSYSMLTAELEPDEAIKAEPGAMVAQAGVDMTTGKGGGNIIGGLRRMMAGESFFVNTFRGGHYGGWVSLAPPSPGDIIQQDISPGQNLFIQGSSYLASTEHVETDSQFQGMKGMFSGEGMFFIRAQAKEDTGTVWFNAYGAVKEVHITPGQDLTVDTGHLVAFTEGIEYSVTKVGGIGSMVAGGEGLVMKMTGAGTAWIQTRNLKAMADKLRPFLPSKK